MGIEEAGATEHDDQSLTKLDDRIKFLYSYGGRIVPRHGDWKLRYVGGETRVMAVNGNITFADLMAKMREVSGSNPVLKCQLPTQDLDALVSIKSDEDLQNILEEYNRQGTKQGSSKVRAFLFLGAGSPSNLPVAARTCCGHPSRLPRWTTIPRQRISADRAMSSVYVDSPHCLRSVLMNSRQSLPHYNSSPSLFPSTQNTQQLMRSYMKVA